MNIDAKLRPRTRAALLTALKTPLVLKSDASGIKYDFSVVEDDKEMWALMHHWKRNKINAVAVDLEFESTMHYRDLHQICTVQIYDGTKYYIVDGIKLTRRNLAAKRGKKGTTSGGALKAFFESRDITKVMFSCTNDGAITKAHGITLNNAYDVQRLGNMVATRGLSLVTFISIFLGLNIEDGEVVGAPEKSDTKKSDDTLATEMKQHKKKCQTFDWTSRPLPIQQVVYALSDVEYLFSLKETILREISRKYKSDAVKYANELAAYDKGAYVVTKPKTDLNFTPGYEKLKSATAKIANGIYSQATLIARNYLKRFTEFLPLENVVKLAEKISADGVESVTLGYMTRLFCTQEAEIATALLDKLKELYKSCEPKADESEKETKERNNGGRLSTKTATHKDIQKAKGRVTANRKSTVTIYRKQTTTNKKNMNRNIAPPNKRIKFK